MHNADSGGQGTGAGVTQGLLYRFNRSFWIRAEHDIFVGKRVSDASIHDADKEKLEERKKPVRHSRPQSSSEGYRTGVCPLFGLYWSPQGFESDMVPSRAFVAMTTRWIQNTGNATLIDYWINGIIRHIFRTKSVRINRIGTLFLEKPQIGHLPCAIDIIPN